MRLIHVTRLDFEEFADLETPRYAILSHTWNNAEVTFQEMQFAISINKKNGQNLAKDEARANHLGYAKVLASCRMAEFIGIEYVWIDTCCIDKSSSAELSEAINSMYSWYHRSEICFIYLSDVSMSNISLSSGVRISETESFRNSRWFTRGWTLQELIAPTQTLWFERDWLLIGSIDASPVSSTQLLLSVAEITGIDVNVIQTGDMTGISIAAKMSWAAMRQTTRLEDRAYCLLGLFDVNMPMLYGEGSKAFIRLQEEIIKSSPDQTIFAWSTPPTSQTDEETSKQIVSHELVGFLAESPIAFRDCADILPLSRATNRSPHSITNKGLRIELEIYMPIRDIPIAILQCCRAEAPESLLGVYIQCPWHDDTYWFPALRNIREMLGIEDVFRLKCPSSPVALPIESLGSLHPRLLHFPQRPSMMPLVGGREPCCVFRRIPANYTPSRLLPSSRWNVGKRITRLTARGPSYRMAAIQLDSNVQSERREDDLSIFVRIIQDVRSGRIRAFVISGGYGLWGTAGRRFLTDADLENEAFWSNGTVTDSRAHLFPRGAMAVQTTTIQVLKISVVQVDLDVVFEVSGDVSAPKRSGTDAEAATNISHHILVTDAN